MNEEDDGFSEWLSKVASDASKNAIQECIDLKIPYVVLHENQLLKIYTDGKQEILKEYTYDELYITLDKLKIYRVDNNAKH